MALLLRAGLILLLAQSFTVYAALYPSGCSTVNKCPCSIVPIDGGCGKGIYSYDWCWVDYNGCADAQPTFYRPSTTKYEPWVYCSTIGCPTTAPTNHPTPNPTQVTIAPTLRPTNAPLTTTNACIYRCSNPDFNGCFNGCSSPGTSLVSINNVFAKVCCMDGSHFSSFVQSNTAISATCSSDQTCPTQPPTQTPTHGPTTAPIVSLTATPTTATPTSEDKPVDAPTALPETEKSLQEAGCFPGEAVVETASRQIISLDMLRVGDLVRVSNDRVQPMQPILYFSGHWRMDGLRSDQLDYDVPYIRLTTLNETFLVEATLGHLIILFRGNNEIQIPMRNVRAGDQLLTRTGYSEVTRVERLTRRTAFTPITRTGRIVVNGVEMSCFTDAMLPAYIFQFVLPLLDLLHRMLPLRVFTALVQGIDYVIGLISIADSSLRPMAVGLSSGRFHGISIF